MKIELLARILRSWLLQIFFKRRPRDMVNVIKWAQTQNQEQLAEIGKRLEEKVMPKTSQSKVADNLEKAYHKNDPKELIFWLTYAQVFRIPVRKKREFFKKIKELWLLAQRSHAEMSNMFNYLNGIFAERAAERSDSKQMVNETAIYSQLSYI